MKVTVFILAALLLIGCQQRSPETRMRRPGEISNPALHPSSPAGEMSQVGNGGDFLPIVFEAGREHAIELLSRIDLEAIPSVFLKILKPGDIEWAMLHRTELVEKIRGSEAQWVDKMPPGCPDHKCACTFGDRQVYFSLQYCGGESSTLAAATVHIHEAVHQVTRGLCADPQEEARANRIAAAVYLSWQSLGHPLVTHIRSAATHEMVRQSTPIWTGAKMITFDAETLTSYSPARDETEFTSLDSSVASRAERVVWAGDKIFALSRCYEREALPYAVTLDLGEGRWKEFAMQTAPPPQRQQMRTFVLGNRLVTYGGFECGADAGQERALFDGYTLDLSGKAWRKIPALEVLKGKSGQVVSPVGTDKLVVWGGRSNQIGKERYFASGAIYDLREGTWEGIPKSILSPREGAIAIPVGPKLFIVGGRFNELPLSDGAVFDSGVNRWQTIPASPIALSRDEVAVTYNRTHLFFFGPSFVLIYDQFHHRWEVPNRLIWPEVGSNLLAFWTGIEVIIWGNSDSFLLYP